MVLTEDGLITLYEGDIVDLTLPGVVGACNREALYAEDYKYFALLRCWF